ncbi:hypothetical protein D3C78_620310 [compost metagenome]
MGCCVLCLVVIAAAWVQALEPVPRAVRIGRPGGAQRLQAFQQDALGLQLEGRQLPAQFGQFDILRGGGPPCPAQLAQRGADRGLPRGRQPFELRDPLCRRGHAASFQPQRDQQQTDIRTALVLQLQAAIGHARAGVQVDGKIP